MASDVLSPLVIAEWEMVTNVEGGNRTEWPCSVVCVLYSL